MNKDKIDSVQDFVDKYNDLASDTAKEKFLKSIIKTNYIDYLTKITLANKIVEAAFYDDPTNENKKIVINSPVRYLLYVYTVITQYTDIPMSNKDMAKDYDILDQYGLVDKIFGHISKSELDEFNKIIDMVYEDMISNNYETRAYISNLLDRIAPTLQTLSDLITPEVIDVFFGESGGFTMDNVRKALVIMNKMRK